MSLCERIRGNRTKILKQMLKEVLETYPDQARPLIAIGSDRFGNPLGATLSEGVEEIFEVVADLKSIDEIDLPLERMFKLKAIQEGKTNESLDFLFSLKTIIRNDCKADVHDPDEIKEWLEIEERIDQIVKRGLQVFITSREKLLELQVAELKHRTYSLRKLSGELSPTEAPPPGQEQ